MFFGINIAGAMNKEATVLNRVPGRLESVYLPICLKNLSRKYHRTLSILARKILVLTVSGKGHSQGNKS